jgi:hypothetical protein
MQMIAPNILADAASVDLSAVFGHTKRSAKFSRNYPRTETRRIVIRGADGRRKSITVTVVILTSAGRARLGRKAA